MRLKLPEGKKFIFTIIDDTDDAFLNKIKPVYNLLHKNRILITKTIWVYPVRDNDRSKGDSLENLNYRNFIFDLQKKGFEIGLHNVGSGKFFRKEIIKGLKKFKEYFGEYPNIHINHSYNNDNIYCGPKRFSFPFNIILKYLYPNYSNFSGEIKDSPHFWGDLHKELIKYSRNYEIDDINTFKANPYMPYRDEKYDEFCNHWFSSTFAPNQWVFNKKINKESIDKLENEGGVCILYTHLGYFYKQNKIDPGFKEMIEYIGNKKTGLFVPVSETLKILEKNKSLNNIPDYLPKIFKFKLEFFSLLTRIKYRFFDKIDDFHFKKSNDYIEN